MRRTAMIVMLLASATALFARGASEEAQTMGRFSDDFEPAQVVQREEVEITGTYDVIDGYPVIRVGDDVYTVSAPRGPIILDEIEVGAEVSITGWLNDDPANEEIDVDGHIVLDSATVNGEAIDLSVGRGGPRGMWSDDENTMSSASRFGQMDDQRPTDRMRTAPRPRSRQ